jgi:YesN/AraC family two-component response regulator
MAQNGHLLDLSAATHLHLVITDNKMPDTDGIFGAAQLYRHA